MNNQLLLLSCTIDNHEKPGEEFLCILLPHGNGSDLWTDSRNLEKADGSEDVRQITNINVACFRRLDSWGEGRERRYPWLSHATLHLGCFSCSHLFAPSPQAEHAELVNNSSANIWQRIRKPCYLNNLPHPQSLVIIWREEGGKLTFYASSHHPPLALLACSVLPN